MSEGLKKYSCRGVQFCSGGAGYGLIEILFRGYTHISMLIAGGLCFCMLIRIAKSRRRMPIRIVTGALCISVVEFAAGCIVNLWLGLDVWDYSGESFHLFGQICPRFMLIWCLLCAVIIPLCELCTKRIPTMSRFSLSSLIGRLWGTASGKTE